MSPPRLGRLGALGLLGLGSALVFAVSALSSWPGCTIYDTSLLLPDDGGTCGARWPSPPAQDDPSQTPDTPVVVAMQSIDIGVGPDAGPLGVDSSAPLPPFGYDLDKTCTCPGATTCKQAPGTTKICDDDAGRDHIALQLFRDLAPSSQAGSLQANQAMQAGQFGILLQITGYNQRANDTQVSVRLYASNGIDGIQDGGTPSPNHDGNDKWTVDPAYLVQGQLLGNIDCETNSSACTPEFVDDHAYVSGGVLVAHLSSAPLTFGYRANLGGALMMLTDAVIVGTLRQVTLFGSFQGWSIADGSISGRWQTSQLLSNLATIPNPLLDGSFVCGTDPLGAPVYRYFKPLICGLQDIASSERNDNKGVPCDALSMGFAFQAEPARLGSVYRVDQPPAGCVGSGGAQWQDDCDSGF